jgi:hypothetical protein
MWASMEAVNPSSSKGAGGHTRRDGLLDWANASGNFDELSEQDLLITRSNGDEPAARIRRQREMAELERWLQEDDEMEAIRLKQDPWKADVPGAGGGLVDSPTASLFQEAQGTATGITGSDSDHKTGFKFDDDFTAFVSAPAEDHEEGEHGSDVPGPPSAALHSATSFDTELLTPADISLTYHALGSQSDLGSASGQFPESIDEDPEDADSDDILPSEEDIELSAERIFGVGLSSGAGSRDIPHSELEGFPEDDEFDFAAFDLSRVMSALEGMKMEIANMEDDNERRRAAAKAALGLVYGLERQREYLSVS